MAKKSSIMSKAPIRKALKKSGVNLMAAKAVDTHIQHQGEHLSKLTKKALLFATHAKRTKITKADVILAIKYL